MAAPSTTYEPRCPAQTALYQIVRDHFETFRVQAACLRDVGRRCGNTWMKKVVPHATQR